MIWKRTTGLHGENGARRAAKIDCEIDLRSFTFTLVTRPLKGVEAMPLSRNIFQKYHRAIMASAASVARLFLVFIGALAITLAVAQANSVSGSATQPARSSSLGITDEPFALHEGLIRELRKGGYVIFIRHGAVQPGTIDNRTTGEWWKNCQRTQRTNATALPAAQAIGVALKTQRVVVSDVQTSEFCRAFDTGVFLGLSLPTRNAALNAITAFESQRRSLADQAGGIINLISTVPPSGMNRILVGHALSPTIVHPLFAHLEEGHTLVFKPEGGARFHFVASISPGQWQFIGKQLISDGQQFVVQASLPQGSAQIAQPGPPQVLQPSQAPAQPQPPLIDPNRELKSLALLQALRAGGFNLYMRHAQATVGTDQDLLKVPTWWENCMIQRNISDVGRAQAKKVGDAIKQLRLPVAEIKVSQFCRVRDTAISMALGPVEITEALNHQIGQREGTDVYAMRFKLLTTTPSNRSNTLMISHTHGSPRAEERVMSGIQEAEIVIYLPDGKGNAEPVARIAPAEWDSLISLDKSNPSAAQTTKGK